ncbi:hypothetical protein SAMCFNEI73_Ch2327 [Sinorhizobium americanum]|uniref:Uncharacterized protein n=1 Tax=Sinorhizobium americanum TaxID=194963 RepID=A0A1L3LNC8_9HYPH|nr:hypothetical protein SAMCFNEI73_Ch2327 [Sinorhizobium americanum]
MCCHLYSALGATGLLGQKATVLLISPLVGEMPGRQRGVLRSYASTQRARRVSFARLEVAGRRMKERALRKTKPASLPAADLRQNGR